MSECMMFPSKWEKFIEDYSFNDSEEVYTNGTKLVPVFRVEQMVEYYFAKDTNVPSWIPVSERLPEVGDRCLCNVKSFSFPGSFYQAILKYDKYGFVEGCIYTDDVTHWMPLPEPPQEK